MKTRRNRDVVAERWMICVALVALISAGVDAVHAFVPPCDEPGATCTQCESPSIEIIGTSFGGDDIHIHTYDIDHDSHITGLQIFWRVYSPCGDCNSWGYDAKLLIDSGGSPWSQNLDSGVSGQIMSSSVFAFGLSAFSCQHTFTIKAKINNGGGDCNVNPAYSELESNPITVWFDNSAESPKTMASCTNGPPACQKATVGLPVDIASGNMFYEMEDLRIEGPLRLSFVRRFDSNSAASGTLGYGWQHNGMIRLENVNDQGTQILIDQQMRRIAFNCARGETINNGGNCRGLWQPNTIDHLTLTQALEPASWEVTDKHGTKYQFDGTGKLTLIRDRNGNTLTYGYDAGTGNLTSITDAFGRAIALTYYSGTSCAPVRNSVRRSI